MKRVIESLYETLRVIAEEQVKCDPISDDEELGNLLSVETTIHDLIKYYE